jgi:hypothetical protein
MATRRSRAGSGKPKSPTKQQVSAGGITFRRGKSGVQVALILVSEAIGMLTFKSERHVVRKATMVMATL